MQKRAFVISQCHQFLVRKYALRVFVQINAIALFCKLPFSILFYRIPVYIFPDDELTVILMEEKVNNSE